MNWSNLITAFNCVPDDFPVTWVLGKLTQPWYVALLLTTRLAGAFSSLLGGWNEQRKTVVLAGYLLLCTKTLTIWESLWPCMHRHIVFLGAGCLNIVQRPFCQDSVNWLKSSQRLAGFKVVYSAAVFWMLCNAPFFEGGGAPPHPTKWMQRRLGLRFSKLVTRMKLMNASYQVFWLENWL